MIHFSAISPSPNFYLFIFNWLSSTIKHYFFADDVVILVTSGEIMHSSHFLFQCFNLCPYITSSITNTTEVRWLDRVIPPLSQYSRWLKWGDGISVSPQQAKWNRKKGWDGKQAMINTMRE